MIQVIKVMEEEDNFRSVTPYMFEYGLKQGKTGNHLGELPGEGAVSCLTRR